MLHHLHDRGCTQARRKCAARSRVILTPALADEAGRFGRRMHAAFAEWVNAHSLFSFRSSIGVRASSSLMDRPIFFLQALANVER